MHRYDLFGGCLESELEFPELPASVATTPEWRFTVGAGSRVEPDGPLIGLEDVDAGCVVRSYQQSDGVRLVYDDTGAFDVRADGGQITWYRASAAQEAAARLDLTGRVLATALHLQGVLALHGSAVAVDGKAIAFVAPKTYGKSTLAFALSRSGARFLSDDTLPVEPGVAPAVRPGIDHVRLPGDSAERLLPANRLTTNPPGAKHLIGMPVASAGARTPLDAVYVVAPKAAAVGDSAVRRRRLSTVPAALSLVRHAKVGALLGGEAAARLLGHATAIARVTPIYLLDVARDLDRLPEVVTGILEWHSTGAAEQAAPPSVRFPG